MKLNLKVRLKNPVFCVQLIAAFFLPIMAYANITAEQITNWSMLFEMLKNAVNNPYVLYLIGLSVFNAVNDPTTRGIKDSDTALNYNKPN